eukprot:365429-Chlamydomonas_euryale.AAC.3
MLNDRGTRWWQAHEMRHTLVAGTRDASRVGHTAGCQLSRTLNSLHGNRGARGCCCLRLLCPAAGAAPSLAPKLPLLDTATACLCRACRP